MITDFTSIKFSDFAHKNESIFSDNEESDSADEMLSEFNYSKIFDILNFKGLSIDEEDNTKENDSPIKIKKDLFVVTESTNHKTQLTKKKRGKPSYLNIDKARVHDRFAIDNLLAKIKNHSLSLIPPFLNDILKVLSIEEEFYQLSHKYKKNIKNDFFSESKKTTLGEIICNKISSKYKNHDENENKRIYDKVKDNEVLKKIFNMDYVTFFKRYYMESKKCINLRAYGLENEIVLSEKCKMYNDLIKRIKNSNIDDNENYLKCIKKCIDKNYIRKNLFKTSK